MFSTKLMFPDGKSKRIIRIKNIVYCKADNCYTEIYLLGESKPFCVSKNIKSIEKMMPKGQFFRSHQSYLINIDFIENLLPKKHLIELKTGKMTKLSRRMYQKLRNTMSFNHKKLPNS